MSSLATLTPPKISRSWSASRCSPGSLCPPRSYSAWIVRVVSCKRDHTPPEYRSHLPLSLPLLPFMSYLLPFCVVLPACCLTAPPEILSPAEAALALPTLRHRQPCLPVQQLAVVRLQPRGPFQYFPRSMAVALPVELLGALPHLLHPHAPPAVSLQQMLQRFLSCIGYHLVGVARQHRQHPHAPQVP